MKTISDYSPTPAKILLLSSLLLIYFFTFLLVASDPKSKSSMANSPATQPGQNLATWRCEWSPCDEPDIAGYTVSWRPSTSQQWLFRITVPASQCFAIIHCSRKITLCAAVQAFDTSGNISAHTATTCAAPNGENFSPLPYEDQQPSHR